jgi:hypothetical protein
MITIRVTTALNLVKGADDRAAGERTSRLSSVPIYAAYGSNMHPEQMLERAPHSPMAGTGWLHGWRLTFGGEDIGWDGALATVVQDPESKVFVVLYDMTKEDEKNLDRWEGSELGVHKKIRCRVDRTASDTSFEPVLAWLYVIDAWEGGIPSARYLGVMADAAEIAGAPAEYVHDLRTRPARNIGPGT